jgi:SAM-dependent methyltransferase
MTLLDVGTGSGGNVAIPAAQRGAHVVGVDVTPELLALARERAARAKVGIEWIEADAVDLPFPDDRFDRVVSTFGAMFASDHRRAAAELLRVCAPGGRVLMTSWTDDSFAGELFSLSASFMPAAPNGAQPPSAWGSRDHIAEVFGVLGARPLLTREMVPFRFPSVEHAVKSYAEHFGPFVVARTILEPEGRWAAFLDAFEKLIRRFARSAGGGTEIESEYFVIAVDRQWVRPKERKRTAGADGGESRSTNQGDRDGIATG